MGKEAYHVYGSMMQGNAGQMMMLHFINCTEYVHLRDEAATRQPAIAIIAIDNYEELMKNATDSEKIRYSGCDRQAPVRLDAGQQGGAAQV